MMSNNSNLRIFIFRYPHGYFQGGLFNADIMPVLTVHGFQANNFVVIEYEELK